MADVFISYKREEREDVEAIARELRSLHLDVWFDASLDPGSSFDEEINREVRNARCVLVMWSPGAIASDWVRAEASIGKARDVLVSAFLRPCELYPPFNLVHTERLDGFVGDTRHAGWRKVVDSIGRKIGRPGLDAYLDCEGAPDRLWRWANDWSADPLATVIWEERIARASHDEAQRLRDTYDRLLAEGAGRTAQPRTLLPTADDERVRAEITRTPRVHGFARWSLLIALALNAVWMLYITVVGAPNFYQTTFGGALTLSFVIAPMVAFLAAWVTRWLWPRGAGRLSIRRAASIFAAALMADVAIVAAVSTGAYALAAGSLTGLVTLSGVLFHFSMNLGLLALAQAITLVAYTTSLRRRITLNRPSLVGRLAATGAAAAATVGGVWIITNTSAQLSPSTPDQYVVWLELQRTGFAPGQATTEPTDELVSEGVRAFEAANDMPITGRLTRRLYGRLTNTTAKTWRVGTSEGADTASIEEALTRAVEGTTVYVEPGTYTVNQLLIPEGVRLIGSHERTIIQDDIQDGTAVAIITLEQRSQVYALAVQRRYDHHAIATWDLSEGALLEGVRVSDTGGEGEFTHAALAVRADATVRDVTLTGIRGWAIDASMGETGVIENSTISNSIGGILITGGGTIRGNTLTEIAGKAFDTSSTMLSQPTALVENNVIVGAHTAFVSREGAIQFRNNRVSSITNTCVAYLGSTTATVTGNRFSGCGTAGYTPFVIRSPAAGTIEDNIVLASGQNFTRQDPGATTIVRNNRTSD